MAIVENNIVKMEWDKSGWLQTSARGGKKSIFILASKDYETADGRTISVIFNEKAVFLFISNQGEDDEDIWTARELIDTIKADMPGGFPYNLDEYYPIIDYGEEECNAAVLRRYGLEEHKEDIEARLKDLKPYGAEEIVNL